MTRSNKTSDAVVTGTNSEWYDLRDIDNKNNVAAAGRGIRHFDPSATFQDNPPLLIETGDRPSIGC